jgi:chromosome partitioning protein
MRTLAIANQKGGAGKTATAHALGVALAQMGRRVLLVDCDPQSSLTGSCGVTDAAGRSMAEVIGGALPGTLTLGGIVRDLGGGLFLAPSDIALASGELGLATRMGRENVLRRVLATVADAYDVAILDAPPSLGLLTAATLTAAQGILIPTQAQGVDLRALRLFLASVTLVQKALNPDLAIVGIVVTMYDARLGHHRDALAMLESSGLPLLRVRIGRSVKVAEAATAGQTVLTYEPRNPQAQAYRELAEVIDRWLQENAQA